MKNKDTGFLGENRASSYLLDLGFEILEKNWRYKHLEIDIIACKNGFLHIVEVKTRSSTEFGFPEQIVNQKKMQYIRNAAAHYQYQYPHYKWLQFDIIAIYKKPNDDWALDYFEDVYF